MQDDKPKLHIESDWVKDEPSSPAEKPSLQVDSDWKAQAQAEKERLAQKEATAPEGESGPIGMEKLPPADFRGLLGFLTQQAMMGLGVMGDEKTGRVVIDLDGSRYWIDMLDLVEKKTEGNLSDEEKSELSQVLVELRARFVQISQLVAEQMAAGGGGMPGMPGMPTSPESPLGG